jgi:hypothetical protein
MAKEIIATQKWVLENAGSGSFVLDGYERHQRRSVGSAAGAVSLAEADGDEVFISTADSIQLGSIIPDPSSEHTLMYIGILRNDADHDIVMSANYVPGNVDARQVEIPVGEVSWFRAFRRPAQAEEYWEWVNPPKPVREYERAIDGSVSNGTIKFPLRNSRGIPIELKSVWVVSGSGSGTLIGTVVGKSPIWLIGNRPSINTSGVETTTFDDGYIDAGDTIQFEITGASGLEDVHLVVTYADAPYGVVLNGDSEPPPPPPDPVEQGIVFATGGDINADGAMSLSTATLTALDAATVGDDSVMASNEVFIALSDYSDSTVGGVRVWIDVDPGATWSSELVQGLPGFVRYDGKAPFTVSGAGGTPDYCYAWDVTTDPTGFNDPSFDEDGQHTIYVQILRGNDVEKLTATFTVDTTRSTGGGGDPVAPDAPTNLNATAGTNSVSLTWTASTGAEFYEIIYRVVGQQQETIVPNVTATSRTVSGLTAGTQYEFFVRAVGDTGLRSDLSTSDTATPTGTQGSGGYGESLITNAVSSQAVRKTTTCQGGVVVWGNNIGPTGDKYAIKIPLTTAMVNNSRFVQFQSSFMTSGADLSVSRWSNGRGTSVSIHDGPNKMSTVHGLSYGSNCKYVNDNNVKTFQRMADIANGAIDTAIIQGVRNLFNQTNGNVAKGYWISHTVIRLGWELGGMWNPVFPGIDLKLATQITRATGFSSEVNAAWNEVIDGNARSPEGGDRFPMFKLAWDRFTRLCDEECERLFDAAGLPREYIRFCANLAHGDADPNAADTSDGPGSQWVPQCVTEVERTPDLIGWDFYGRGGGGIKPVLTGQANGDPANYDCSGMKAEMDVLRDLCLQTDRPFAVPEFGSCRRRNPASTVGTGWDDHYRAAFTNYALDYWDRGCDGAGVKIFLINTFMQDDCSDVEREQRISNNISYTHHTDEIPCDNISMQAATRMRQAMATWYAPAITDP